MRMGTSLHQGPTLRGAAGLEPASTSALPLSYTPDGRRSTRPHVFWPNPWVGFAVAKPSAEQETMHGFLRGRPGIEPASPPRHGCRRTCLAAQRRLASHKEPGREHPHDAVRKTVLQSLHDREAVSRVHVRGCFTGEAGFEPATYGSKDRRAAHCTTRLTRHKSPCDGHRFARPHSRWASSASVGGGRHIACLYATMLRLV